MSNMEILSHNYINTTGIISLSHDFTAFTQPSDLFKLIDREPANRFVSSVSPTKASSYIIIDFNKTLTVDRLSLQNFDLKRLTIFYSNDNFITGTFGSGVNYFNEDNSTQTSAMNSITSSNFYLKIDREISAKSMIFALNKNDGSETTIDLGQLYVGKSLFTFPYNPSVKNYKPNISQNKFEHKMADGGSRVYVTDSNFDTSIKIKYLTETERDTLFNDVYNNYRDFVFIPDPITGAVSEGNPEEWNAEFYAVNWIGSFGRDYADNYKENGYNVDMKFKELSK